MSSDHILKEMFPKSPELWEGEEQPSAPATAAPVSEADAIRAAFPNSYQDMVEPGPESS